MTILEAIPAPISADRWREVSELVVKALSRGRRLRDEFDVLAALQDRDLQLWAARDASGVKAICITQIIDYPFGRACQLHIAGESMEAFMEHEENIVHWAREQDCQFLMATGRPGWERVLEGWTKTGVVMEREL